MTSKVSYRSGQKTQLLPGQLIGRYVKALMIGRGDVLLANSFAEGAGESWQEVAYALRAAVNPISTSGGASQLTYPIAYDFNEILRPLTVLGKLQGTRKSPFNVRLINISEGATAAWVGEGLPIPASALNFDTDTKLAFTKVAAMSLYSQELARSSSPNVESVLTADVSKASAAAIDSALLDPGNAGSSSKPTSITYGATSITSAGTSVANVDSDLKQAIAVLVAANISLDFAQWVMAPKTAVYLSTLRSSGQPAFPGMSAKGGLLLGLPVVTSNTMIDGASPPLANIVLIAADQLIVADDGQTDISVSEQASIQADDAPSSSASDLTSLWQQNLLALRSIHSINWTMAREDAVVVIESANF